MFVSSMTLGGESAYSLDEARAVIAGCAFATRPLAWLPPKGSPSFGDPPAAAAVPIWAYGTDDQVQGSVDERTGAIDVLVTAGLNGRIDSKLSPSGAWSGPTC